MNTQPKQPDQPPENVRSIKFEALLRELKRLVNEHGELRRLALSRPELEPKVLETLERIVELSQELRKEYDQWDPTD